MIAITMYFWCCGASTNGRKMSNTTFAHVCAGLGTEIFGMSVVGVDPTKLATHTLANQLLNLRVQIWPPERFMQLVPHLGNPRVPSMSESKDAFV